MSNPNSLMKGHVFAKRKHKLTYPCSMEVKVDEIRLDVRREPQDGVSLRSYADKPLHNLGLWGARLATFMAAHRVNRLDMGVLVNKNFADTYRYVRSSKGTPGELHDAYVEFILFDVPDYTELPYIDRIQQRRRLCNLLNDYQVPTCVPRRRVAMGEQDVHDYYAQVRSEGFEGLMVKSHDHHYQPGKRIDGWLKVKSEADADAFVTGVTEAVSEDGARLARVGSIQGRDEHGQKVSIPGIDHDTARSWWEDPTQIIGKWVEFQYMERDRQDGYRHPRFNRIREDKQ